MSEISVLLVDDEADLIWAVERSLAFAGYQVLTAQDGPEALSIARRHFPDLAILDINIPGLDGIEVCRQMRLDPMLTNIPIIFLTQRSAAIDKISGLDEGADDYIVKPFDLQELKARMRALLRRAHKTAHESDKRDAKDILLAGPMALDPNTRQVHLKDRIVQLTSTEFDLLYFLITHPGKVFSCQQLLQQIWRYPPGSGETGLVRWHIKNLRTKLEADPTHPTYLRSVARQGYMLERRQNPR